MKQTAVDFLIMQIELKADSIPCNTQLNRSVKGAYVDCLVMLKQTKEMEKQQRNYFVELSKWIIENKRSVFDNADISYESKRKILNELGYSSGDY
jgi:hypothetical protein